MKRGCRILLALWLALSASAGAQPTGPREERWIPVRGNAVQLAIASDGTVFVLDGEGRTWRRRGGAAEPWSPVPGDFVRIDAGAGGIVWGIDHDGAVYRSASGSWTRVPGAARDIGVGPDGSAYILEPGGALSRYDADARAFAPFAAAPPGTRRVEVDEAGLPWLVLEDGSIVRHNGAEWRALPAPLRVREIAIGPDGSVFAVSLDLRLYRLERAGPAWRAIETPDPPVSVGAGPGGRPWIATADGSILATDLFGSVAARAVRSAPVFSRQLPWRPVRGTGRELAIGPRGEVYAVGTAGEVWQWKGRETWSRLPGRLERVAVAPTGLPWGVDERGRILQFHNGTWIELPGTAREIAIGAFGAAWIVQPDGVPARWDPSMRSWNPAPGIAASRIAVDTESRPWVVAAADGTVLRLEGSRWEPLPGVQALDIAVGPEDTVYAAGTDGRPYRYHPLHREWVAVNGEAVRIAVGPRGLPWALTARSEINATSLFDEELEQKAVEARATPSITLPQPVGSTVQPARRPAPFFFQKVPGTARDVAIGNEGSVFAIGFDGNLLRWSNSRNAFQPFPGTAQRIAVQRDGRPWAVTTAGQVFRYDGADWQVVRNIFALDIAIGGAAEGRDDVIVTDANQALWRYDAAAERFNQIFSASGNAAPAGTRVAVDNRGRPWTITSDNQVFRCDADPCVFVDRARDIAIGPDNSVFAIDADRLIRRFDPAAGRFERIETSVSGVDAIAVGPRGVPWVVKANAEVLSGGFFERDESKDDQTARATVLTTTPTPAAPVFTFSLSMRFDPVAIAQPPFNIAISAKGLVIAIEPGGNVYQFDPKTNAFVLNAALNPPVPFFRLGIEADGTLWGVDFTNILRRREKNAYVTFPGLTSNTGTPSPIGIGVGADGSVLATSPDNTLFRFDPQLRRFVKTEFQFSGSDNQLSVDPKGRPWVIDAFNDIFEFTGAGFEKRPGKALDVWAGANGSVFICDDAQRLKRWNPGAQNWDVVSGVQCTEVALAPDGRPWVITPPPVRVLRAR